jgi:pantetheine-phosphate adenylyltransferase
MNKKIALITGSMNPFTKGHKYVVDMSLIVFDSVVIGIGKNPAKETENQLFTLDQRIRMTRESLKECGSRAVVSSFSGAAVDFANEMKASAIVRGIRNNMDEAYETSMSHVNSLMAEIEVGRIIPTFYVPCPPSLTEVSSSRVRELIDLRRSMEVLRHFVLPAVADVIEKEIYTKTG